MMKSSGVVVSGCKCETPDFDVIWKTRMCVICRKLTRSIDIVLCSKCGGKVPSERIPEEIKRQEEDCGHKAIDRAFESLRYSE
jgi:hypothetical protein